MTDTTAAPAAAPRRARSARSAGRRRALPRGRGPLRAPRTVPARLYLWTAAVAVGIAGLFGAVHAGVAEARDGLQVVGRAAGPQAVNTGGLYLALSGMDAQLAGVLLIGREHSLGQGRDVSMAMYEQRRSEAGRAILETFDITRQNEQGRTTVQSVLDGLGEYERLAARAIVLAEQTRYSAGPPPREVLAVYRRATDLMHTELLPQAYNLTLESAAIVRRTYVSETDRATNALIRVGVAAVVLLAVLAAFQLGISRRFRRTLNPPLALATLAVVVLSGLALTSLARSSAHLREAKEEGFDTALTYTRARAISSTAAADQLRWLLDPDRAETYEQVYFDTSQTIAYVPAGNLADYYAAIAQAPLKGGFLQDADAADPVLVRYRAFQKTDRSLRELVGDGRTRQAIVLRTGTAVGTYDAYDLELSKLVGAGKAAFNGGIEQAETDLEDWDTGLPAGALAVLALVLLGVRPRLAEFR
ncbi:hypothetical protein EDD29_0946 [Actinocorallia herbida]|uniref:Uncharacterized protein n=1 Tax=Actinocorallia herbida TaxID=58109 RepID=A0A3N1CQ94_9ACTN|nr:hypothetical protein [Actinocorallia herbida]ROO83443.1 hypothetical protein EDD29_0946 [Actinocorallia herbida]